MKLMPMGDYYVWYCEWCDSRNLTLWTRIESEKVVCGACHGRFTVPDLAHSGNERLYAQIL